MPVSRLVPVTVAPETAAPEGSVMIPANLADTCATENDTDKQQKNSNQDNEDETFDRALDLKKIGAVPSLGDSSGCATRCILRAPKRVFPKRF